MSNHPHHPGRGHFSSSIGFILAAAGSAIGLGNLWKFPYVTGTNGGGLFILFYLFFILLLGAPIILAEMAIGRKTQLNALGAYKSINKKWKFVGGIGIVCSFVILSYYSVVGGWVLKYISAYLTGGDFGADKAAYFTEFTSSTVSPVIWHVIFMATCAMVVVGGVVKGIEKASKIMLPTLFILIIVVAVKSLTLDGAMEGLRFLFVPNFDAVGSVKEFGQVAVAAMGQVFFSLSLGMGITITYGSYLRKDSDLGKNALLILSLDTLVAILAGIAILPAVFSFGFEPTQGAGLVFITLPAVFESMSFGGAFGLIFFILVYFAAATSAIALLEVVSAYLIDTFHWSRNKATVLSACTMGAIGVFASLSFGPLSGFTIAGMNLFDAMGFFTDKILMPLSGMLMCIFVGHVWGIDNITQEIEVGHTGAFKLKKIFNIIMKYVAPILIFALFIIGVVPVQ